MSATNENNHYLPLEEETIDFKKLFYQIIGNWYWFAISVFVALFIAYLVNRYTEQVFSVHSSLIVREDDNTKGLTGAENLIQGLKLVRNTKSIQNEIGILKTYTMAYRTISELGDDFKVSYVAVGRRGIKESKLYLNSPFKVVFDDPIKVPYNVPIYVTILSEKDYLLEIDGFLGIKQKVPFNKKVTFPNYSFIITYRSTDSFKKELVGKKYYFYLNNTNRLANIYKNKVQISQNDIKGSILTLTSNGFVAQQEADYLNKLMSVYIRTGLEEKNKIAENTIRFIDAQLVDMADTLNKVELVLQSFRINNKVFDLKVEGNLIFEKLRVLGEQKSTNDLKLRYYSYLQDYIITKNKYNEIVAPSSVGIEDQQLTLLLDQINEAYIQHQDLLLSSKSENPILKQTELRLEILRKTFEEKIKSLIDANNLFKENIIANLKSVEQELLQLPLHERQLINIEREYNLIDKLYTYLLEKRAEAAIARASNIPDNKVLDFANFENASIIKPNRKSNYLFSLIIGLLIPSLLIFIFNYFNTKLNNLKDISKFTLTPILGSIGHNKFSTEFPVLEKPKSTLTESFRAIRTNLQYILRDPNQKVITITSTISGEGKTFIAANLAAIISLNQKKVLVLGLDLRKPKLQNYFGVELQKGLSTYLIGRDSAEDIVLSTNYENLFYVPSGPIPPNPAELIGGNKMVEFIEWAKGHFDYIILDTPPIAIVTDALLTQRFSDMVLFVVRFKYSNKEVLRLVENLKQSGESKNISLVINDLQHRRMYGYAYAYNYGYSYGYTYGSGNTYGYGNEEESNEYYTDDEPIYSFKDKIRRLF